MIPGIERLRALRAPDRLGRLRYLCDFISPMFKGGLKCHRLFRPNDSQKGVPRPDQRIPQVRNASLQVRKRHAIDPMPSKVRQLSIDGLPRLLDDYWVVPLRSPPFVWVRDEVFSEDVIGLGAWPLPPKKVAQRASVNQEGFKCDPVGLATVESGGAF